MALKVGQVRAAMASALDEVLGADVQVATAPDQVTPPCLLIGMPAVAYNASFNARTGSLVARQGIDSMRMPVYGILPGVHDQAAVDAADEWISGTGPRSVIEILQADQTLGGACAALVVPDAEPDRWQESDTGSLPAYRWTVEVYG